MIAPALPEEVPHAHGAHVQEPLPLLALGALGVVFGDIGTSPLYALKESLAGPHPLPVDQPRATVAGASTRDRVAASIRGFRSCSIFRVIPPTAIPMTPQ